MKKKSIIINISVAIVFFVLGFLVRMFIPEAPEKDKEETEVADVQDDSVDTVADVNVRIREGYVEWYDGTAWNKVESVEALQAEDTYFLAQEGLDEFETKYLTNLEEVNLSLAEEEAIIMGAPLVGVDNQSSSGSGGVYTPSQSTTTSTPSASTVPTTPSTEAPTTEAPTTEAPSTTESQDGEDIGWSDDYL